MVEESVSISREGVKLISKVLLVLSLMVVDLKTKRFYLIFLMITRNLKKYHLKNVFLIKITLIRFSSLQERLNH